MRNLYAILLVLMGCFAAPAFAQETEDATAEVTEEAIVQTSEVVLWEIQGADTTTVSAFKQGLREALAGEAGRHLLDDAAFAQFFSKASPEVPPCLMGLEPCPSAAGLAFEMAGLSLVIRVELKSTQLANYALIDGRGAEVRTKEITAPGVRELAFALIADVFDATGSVSFNTRPEGATIEIDGEQVGTTPYVTRLSIGTHEYTLKLQKYQPMTGSIVVRSGLTEKVDHVFQEEAGYLLITEAPSGARVFVNGSYVGDAGQPIELEPGMYAIEVRADGYETMRETAKIEPGLEMRKTAPLVATSGFLKDFGSGAIQVNKYQLKLGYEHGFQRLTFQDARGEAYEFESILDGEGTYPIFGANSARVSSNGVRLDLSYFFEYFGITVLSMSYRGSSPDLPVALLNDAGETVEGTLSSVSRLQIRPFQLAYRHVYKNVMPIAEIGVGIDLQWIDVESVAALEPIALSQTDAFATIGFGAQYFFTPAFFGKFRYALQAYFEDTHETEHLLYLGVGLALPNLFGLEIEPPETL